MSDFTHGKRCEEADCSGHLNTVFVYTIFHPGPSPEVKLLPDDGVSEHSSSLPTARGLFAPGLVLRAPYSAAIPAEGRAGANT